MGPAEWDTDAARALMRYYIERIDDKINKTDATDFGVDMAGANGTGSAADRLSAPNDPV